MSTIALNRRSAEIYVKASAVFAVQLVWLVIEDQWEWVAAFGILAALVFFFVPEVPQFLSLVINQDGVHATGQRIFGVPSLR